MLNFEHMGLFEGGGYRIRSSLNLKKDQEKLDIGSHRRIVATLVTVRARGSDGLED